MRKLWVVAETPFRIPRNKSGFIDYEGIFKIIYTELRQPYGVLDKLSVREIVWLVEGHLEYQKNYFEILTSSTKIAGASILSGKDLKLFDDVEEKEESIITKESREEDLDYISKQFGEI